MVNGKKMAMKAVALILAILMILAPGIGAMAADERAAVIDKSQTGSLTICKCDQTALENAGQTDSYAVTGQIDQEVENVYQAYAIQGVEFTYLKIGEIETDSVVNDQTGETTIKVIYGLDREANAVMQSLGLEAADAVKVDGGLVYYISDSLIDALAKANQTMSVSVKNILEEFVTDHSGTVMEETGIDGTTVAEGLPVGLYLVVETGVPENVIETTAPFLVSLPMTDPTGEAWIYDVTAYPKNLTGNPELKKDVAEAGRGDDSLFYSTAITASSGDILAYRITSILPTISSEATYLTTYTFADVMDKGLTYLPSEPVVVSWVDPEGNVDAVWQEDDERFTVNYGMDTTGKSTMTIEMTEVGLEEINSCYSQYTVVIDYKAAVNQNENVVIGDGGNQNKVTLRWTRTNTDYSGVLEDTSVVYAYGVKIRKRFSDGQGDASKVQFILKNMTEDTYLTAIKAEEGVYYLEGTVSAAEAATVFSPAADGYLRILGLEADTYVVTELATDSGYTLLIDEILIEIAGNTSVIPCAGCLHTEHRIITASASVNHSEVAMEESSGTVTLTVVNERGYEMPPTGDSGTFMLPMAGVVGGVLLMIFALGKRKKRIS